MIEYQSDVIPPVKNAVEEVLRSIEWLLPKWCQRCTVLWCDDGRDEDLQDGALASCQCFYEYRQVKIWIYPAFLANDIERRRQIIIHEVIHAHTNLIHDFAWNEFKRLLPEDDAPKHRESVLEGLTTQTEAATQDLAYCITQYINRNEAKATTKSKRGR